MELLNILDPSVWLIIAVLTAFIVLARKRVAYGIYTICVFLPAYLIRPTIAGFPTTLLELMILSLFVVWMIDEGRWKRINLFFSKKSENPVPLTYRFPIALLLISAGIGMIVAGGSSASLGILKAYFIEPTLFFIVFIYEIRSYRELKNILRSLGILTIIIGIIAMIQQMTGIGIENPVWAAAETRRVTTLFGYPNAASLLVGPIVALFIGYAHQKKSSMLEKLFIILVITFGTLTIVGAKTTGALIALIVIGFIVLAEKKRTRTLTIAFLVIVITLTLNSASVGDQFRSIADRIHANYLDLESNSLEIRVNQWRETFELLLDRPFFGAGLTGYQSALQPYHQYDFLEIFLYPHNIFFNAWAELGLLGMLSFLWILLLGTSDLIRTIGTTQYQLRKNMARGVLYAWIVIILHGLVDVPFFKNDLSVLFMIMLGLTILLSTNIVSQAE